MVASGCSGAATKRPRMTDRAKGGGPTDGRRADEKGCVRKTNTPVESRKGLEQ
jgi:hypothetical protein